MWHGTFRNFTQDLPLSARFTAGYHKASAGRSLCGPPGFHQQQHQRHTRGQRQVPAGAIRPGLSRVQGGDLSRSSCSGDRGWPSTPPSSSTWGATKISRSRPAPGASEWAWETAFAVNDRTDFLIQVGLDHFSKSDLEGHDTIYTADGDYINPREDYTLGQCQRRRGSARDRGAGHGGDADQALDTDSNPGQVEGDASFTGRPSDLSCLESRAAHENLGPPLDFQSWAMGLSVKRKSFNSLSNVGSCRLIHSRIMAACSFSSSRL